MSRHVGYSRRRTRSSSSIDDAAVTQAKDHWLKVGNSLDVLRVNEKFCDVEVIVNGEVFKAHKVVLAACSTYFEAMFTTGLEEGRKPSVELFDTNPTTFRLLFNYMYKGDISIQEDNVQDIFALANFLNLYEVVNNCSIFLRKKLHKSNAIGVFRFAEFQNCTILKLESKRFVEQHFPEVIVEEEFYDLPKDLLKTFLRSEGLSVYSEYQVFEAAMKWLLKDADERREHVFELMECVRLPLISPKQLDAAIAECSDARLKEALQSHLSEHKEELKRLQAERQSMLSLPSQNGISDFQNSYHHIRFQPRMCCRKSVYVIGGNHQSGNYWNDSRPLTIVEKLDTFRWKWKSLPVMSHPRSCLGLAVLNGILYAIGGENDSMILDAVEAFDPLDNEWFSVSSLRQPRTCLGVCALDGHIYAFGGWVGLEVDNCIEKYDPTTNKWEIFDKMPLAMFAMGIIAYEGLIYIIGGFDESSNALDTVYTYNVVTRVFNTLAPMKRKRGFFGLALLHNSIYAVGGSSGTNPSGLRYVERYSILDDSWTEIAPMAAGRSSPSVAAVNDSLLVIGGKMSGDECTIPYTLSTVEIYDPERNKWRDGIPMPTSRCDSAAAVL